MIDCAEGSRHESRCRHAAGAATQRPADKALEVAVERRTRGRAQVLYVRYTGEGFGRRPCLDDRSAAPEERLKPEERDRQGTRKTASRGTREMAERHRASLPCRQPGGPARTLPRAARVGLPPSHGEAVANRRNRCSMRPSVFVASSSLGVSMTFGTVARRGSVMIRRNAASPMYPSPISS